MSGSIRTTLSDVGDTYVAIFGVGTNVTPTISGGSTEPTFPSVGGLNFSHLKWDLIGTVSFLDDDALHPTLNFDAATGHPSTDTIMHFSGGPYLTAHWKLSRLSPFRSPTSACSPSPPCSPGASGEGVNPTNKLQN
jgi:hypothetical protein